MMWIQTALPFFIKRLKSALGSHSYSSAGSSRLSVVKSHQHFQYRQRCQSSFQSRAFHVGCTGTAPILIWILFNHFGFHNTGRQRNPTASLQEIGHGGHMLLQKQPCKFADERQIHSRQIAAVWPQTLSGPWGEGNSEAPKRGYQRERWVCFPRPGTNRGAKAAVWWGTSLLDLESVVSCETAVCCQGRHASFGICSSGLLLFMMQTQNNCEGQTQHLADPSRRTRCPDESSHSWH